MEQKSAKQKNKRNRKKYPKTCSDNNVKPTFVRFCFDEVSVYTLIKIQLILFFCHKKATFSLWTNPHTFSSWPKTKFDISRLNFNFFQVKLAVCLKPSSWSNFLKSLGSKLRIQGRSNAAKVRVEPNLCDQGKREYNAFSFSATLPSFLSTSTLINS